MVWSGMMWSGVEWSGVKCNGIVFVAGSSVGWVMLHVVLGGWVVVGVELSGVESSGAPHPTPLHLIHPLHPGPPLSH
jgi:hypothetical protein